MVLGTFRVNLPKAYARKNDIMWTYPSSKLVTLSDLREDSLSFHEKLRDEMFVSHIALQHCRNLESSLQSLGVCHFFPSPHISIDFQSCPSRPPGAYLPSTATVATCRHTWLPTPLRQPHRRGSPQCQRPRWRSWRKRPRRRWKWFNIRRWELVWQEIFTRKKKRMQSQEF